MTSYRGRGTLGIEHEYSLLVPRSILSERRGELPPEIMTWCHEHFDGQWTEINTYGKLVLTSSKEENLVLFSLKWM